MAAIEPIRITGLADFNRALRTVSTDSSKAVRQAQNKGAKLVVDWAQPRVPSRSGKARASVRATSTKSESRVSGGGARVPWYPWLDFGGRVGRKRSVVRPFDSGGRYIYAGYAARRDEVYAELVRSLIEVVESAGLEVSDG